MMVSISEKVAQNSVAAPTETLSEEDEETSPTEDARPVLKPEEIIDSYVIDRGYDLSGDISNRRFDIWKSGLEIFARRPWLGTTFCGFLPFAQEHMPETYIVSNDYLQMTTLDNDFVNLLVSNGIIAFVAFIGFVLCAIVAAGGTKEDVVQVAYGYGLFTGGSGMHGGSHILHVYIRCAVHAFSLQRHFLAVAGWSGCDRF